MQQSILEIKRRLARLLVEKSYREGDFVLASGRRSDYYFDCRVTALHAEGSWLIGTLFNDLLKDVPVVGVGGMTMGADPLVSATTAISHELGRPLNGLLVRKEAKLAELKEETAGKPGGQAKVAEMEEIVQEMYITYWNRINSSMLRFTDARLLKWKISDAAKYDYIPVMGAGDSIYVKRTPVTNAEYAEYIAATGAKAPSNWVNGKYAAGEENYPVNFVSYDDAQAYCEWLTARDGINTYRLPNESEWELAAGHMPKDADFNCGVNDGRTSVEEYADVTRGAHGAVDFWGNVWEWTSTVRTDDELGVKGGSCKSARTDCRTEHRKESRAATGAYDDVGFRVIQVLNGEEPEQKVELATLGAPVVKAKLFIDR